MTIYRARVLTPDLDGSGRAPLRWLPDAVVEVRDGVLQRVAPYDGGPIDEDLRPAVLLPGFVDGHVHYPRTRIVGSASGPLLDWLARSTFPEEARFAERDHAALVARAFCRALAAAGTTTAFVYSSRHRVAAEEALDALDRAGLRARVGPVWMDSGAPAELCIPPQQSAEDVHALVEAFHGRDADRLQVAVIPRFAVTSSARGLRLAAETAARHDLWVSTHLAENLAECATVEKLHGGRYLDVYAQAGLVHERSVYAHCIHLSEQDWRHFRQAGAVVAHCPDSNAFLGSGNMPVDTVVSRGVPMVIGTDVAAGRSFRVPRMLSSAYDNALVRGYDARPAELLWWGTRAGALALGYPQVGAIAEGLEADLVLLDVPDWVEDVDGVLAWTLFYADAPPPRRTWVRGRTVWDRDADGGVYPWDPAR